MSSNTSTEATVRNTLVAAIQGIASDLGFDEAKGNVKDYPLDYHTGERLQTYLMASVDGKREPRAWAVDVKGSEEWVAMNNTTMRTYLVRVIGYYAEGIDGDNYKLLIDHATKVRGAIVGLYVNLGGVVDRVSKMTPLSHSKRSGIDGNRDIWVGEMTMTAERKNPSF